MAMLKIPSNIAFDSYGINAYRQAKQQQLYRMQQRQAQMQAAYNSYYASAATSSFNRHSSYYFRSIMSDKNYFNNDGDLAGMIGILIGMISLVVIIVGLVWLHEHYDIQVLIVKL